jgi:alkylation response protein AidB-like acyl-CoA dehydrogenase
VGGRAAGHAARVPGFAHTGVFRLHAPRRFGGLEMHPTDMLRLWETIGRIDSSIARNAFMTHAGVPPFSARLPENGVREVYADA